MRTLVAALLLTICASFAPKKRHGVRLPTKCLLAKHRKPSTNHVTDKIAAIEHSLFKLLQQEDYSMNDRIKLTKQLVKLKDVQRDEILHRATKIIRNQRGSRSHYCSAIPFNETDSDHEKRAISGEMLSEQTIVIETNLNLSHPLQLIVLSDTHGLEHQLPALLPDAHVLIHCGDYTGNQYENNLDAYLAQQSHIPLQWVLRGNHDAHNDVFRKSGAVYITKPTQMTLPNGVSFEIHPFRRKQTPVHIVSTTECCHVVLTHEPPFGTLDKTYLGERVGSIPLLHAIQGVPVAPCLWLCGHIHEARGCEWISFGQQGGGNNGTTAVVNAANANSGMAERIVHGPVMITLV
jgi:predicted phosphodiesterase